MDFQFNDEQTQLADALRRFISKECDFEARRAVIASEAGVSDATWKGLVELGLLALPMPAAHDGFDGNAVDLLLVMQELGRGLVIEPYFATIFAAEFIKRAAPQHALLKRIAAGEVKLAAALGERQARHELFNVELAARGQGSGFVLNGSKSVVLHGAQADYLVVSARISGGTRDSSGIGLFLVDARARGVTLNSYRTIDGMRAADIHFASVEVGAAEVLGSPGNAWETLDAVSDYGVSLLCSESIGVMEALNAQTLEYTKTRRQFGQPIARFQALQHRMVEMFMQLEQARSMAYLAAVKVGSEDARERRRAVSAAKVRIGQAARYIGQQAVQLHGGMGVTNELPAAHSFKRLTSIEVTLGDTDHHLARFIAEPHAVRAGARLKAVA
jgi:alkylation response protein AidB-like acyl-CoA dehydrogenase